MTQTHFTGTNVDLFDINNICTNYIINHLELVECN